MPSKLPMPFKSYPERTVWFYFMAKAESESP